MMKKLIRIIVVFVSLAYFGFTSINYAQSQNGIPVNIAKLKLNGSITLDIDQQSFISNINTPYTISDYYSEMSEQNLQEIIVGENKFYFKDGVLEGFEIYDNSFFVGEVLQIQVGQTDADITARVSQELQAPLPNNPEVIVFQVNRNEGLNEVGTDKIVSIAFTNGVVESIFYIMP